MKLPSNSSSSLINRLLTTAVAALAASAFAATAAFAAPKNPPPVTICADGGDWVYNAETGEWTLTGQNDLGSKKFNVSGDLSQLGVSAPNGYLISGYCVKAGTTTCNVTVEPPEAAIVLTGCGTVHDISHFSLTFVTELADEGEWCSPGFWRNNANKHDANQWPVALDTLYNDVISNPSVSGDPTLLDVLNAPQTYGGAAFNAVATYLSQEAGLNVGDSIVHNCPLDQQGGDE